MTLDARGRAAWLATLADLAETAELEVALQHLETAGDESGELARHVAGALKGGRNLGAALAASGLLSPAEAESLRALDTPPLRAGGLRLLVARRVRRAARIQAALAAAVNPLALTLITLLGLQAPMVILDLVRPGQAMRPTLVFLCGLLVLAGALGLVLTRGGEGLWRVAARIPGLGAWLARLAEVDTAFALAELAEDDRPTGAAWSAAAVFVASARHRASLRTLAEHADGPDPRLPGPPWHPALALTVLGGGAAGRLRARALALGEAGERALTGTLVLAVRLLAFAALVGVSWAAVDSLLDADISLPGVPGLPKLDLANPYGDLEKMLEQELK